MKATKHEPHFLLCMIVNSDFAHFISLWFSGAQVHLKYMSMLFYKFVSQTSFLQRNFMDLSAVVILISWLLLIFFIFVLHFPRLGLIPPCQMLVNPCRANDSNQHEDTLILLYSSHIEDVSERDYTKKLLYEIGNFYPNWWKKNTVAWSSDSTEFKSEFSLQLFEVIGHFAEYLVRWSLLLVDFCWLWTKSILWANKESTATAHSSSHGR